MPTKYFNFVTEDVKSCLLLFLAYFNENSIFYVFQRKQILLLQTISSKKNKRIISRGVFSLKLRCLFSIVLQIHLLTTNKNIVAQTWLKMELFVVTFRIAYH